ncbi:MAG: hypothetical protein JWN34_1678, partial [Bryobacterales bacterium]|nr:hypothetical protein [Bryobacterales bacterium]
MKFVKLATCATAAILAFAQAPPPAAPAAPAAPQGGVELDTRIITSVTNIVAPVLVTDRDGNIVDGLQPHQFRLFDNGKEQNIQVDVTYEP